VLRSLILGLLSDESFLAHAQLEPVREYLLAAGADADVVDRRRFQLAEQVAYQFDQYALMRPELLSAWRLGTTLPVGHTQASTERWERDLWLALFGEGGRLAELAKSGGGVTWLSLSNLLDHFPLEELELPGEVHVFGFTSFAPLHQRMLRSFAGRSVTAVYQ